MFKKEVYIDRRNRLKKKLGSGIALFIGNEEAAFNYPANTYHFRQDSHFLYFFGLNHPGFAGVMDVDNDNDYNKDSNRDVLQRLEQKHCDDLDLRLNIFPNFQVRVSRL